MTVGSFMELRKLAVSPSEFVCCMLLEDVAVRGEGVLLVLVL